MPAQPDLSKLSVRQFAERFRGEMIPLSNTFSYFCASVPMSEEDLKEYLEEPVAALAPGIAAALPKVSILLVPYLERANGRDRSKAKAASGELHFHRKAAGGTDHQFHAASSGRGDRAGVRAQGPGGRRLSLPLLPSAGGADGRAPERGSGDPLSHACCARNSTPTRTAK